MHKRIQYSNGAVLLDDFGTTNGGDLTINSTLQSNAVNTVTVQFFADDQFTPVLLPTGSVPSWSANPQANVANDPPLFEVTPLTYNATTTFYEASFYTRSSYASALLAPPGADPVYLTAQFSWIEPGSTEPKKSDTYTAYLSASVNQDGDDGTVLYPPPASLLTTASFGTGHGTVAAGNDARLAGALTIFPSSQGAILSDDFSSGLSQYVQTSTAGKWATGLEPAYVASVRSQIPAKSPDAGTAYAGGLREGHLLVDVDGSWMLYADGGDGTGSGSGYPWHVQMFRSTDLGLTWNYIGVVTPNASNASGTGNVARFGSQYVLYLVKAGGFTGGEIPAVPYSDAVYIGTSATGPFTLSVGTGLTLGATGTYDDQTALTGCVVFYNGQYLNFYSANSSVSGYNVGLATSTSPLGPWTKVGTVLPAGIVGAPENPKVWYSPTMRVWCMTTNQINLGTSRAESSRMYFSASPLDWSNARSITTQRVCTDDGATAIGMACPFILQDGTIAQPNGGEVPFVYDTDPTDSNHRGRSVRYAVLRPSPFSLRYTPGSTGTAPDTCRMALPAPDFVVEFAFQLDAASGTNYFAFDYRVTSGGDCYRLFIQTGASLALAKIVGGVQTTVYVPVGAQHLVAAGTMHRVRIEVSGSAHNAYLDGDLHVAGATDTSLTNAGQAGFASFNAAGAFRLYSARLSDAISLLGTSAGQYTLRASGGIPLVTIASTGGTFSLGSGNTPYPARFLQTPFELLAAPSYGMVGGDAIRPTPSATSDELGLVLSTLKEDKPVTGAPSTPVPTGSTTYPFAALVKSPAAGATPVPAVPGTDYVAPNGTLALGTFSFITGTLPVANLPSAVAGSLHYLGTWNASTNTPTLASGAGPTGGYYVVSTSGSTTIDGVNVWTAGDWIVFDGSRWDKLDGAANPVSSVGGYTGAVTGAQLAAALAGTNASLNSLQISGGANGQQQNYYFPGIGLGSAGMYAMGPTCDSPDVTLIRAAAGIYRVTNAGAGGSTSTATMRFKPPTSDPHVAGELWNNGGTPAISAG